MSKRIMFPDYKTQLRSSEVKMIKEIILPNRIAVTSNTEDTKILAEIRTCKKLLEKLTLQMAEY